MNLSLTWNLYRIHTYKSQIIYEYMWYITVTEYYMTRLRYITASPSGSNSESNCPSRAVTANHWVPAASPGSACKSLWCNSGEFLLLLSRHSESLLRPLGWMVALSGVFKTNGPELLTWEDSHTISRRECFKKWSCDSKEADEDAGGSFWGDVCRGLWNFENEWSCAILVGEFSAQKSRRRLIKKTWRLKLAGKGA